MTKNSMTKKNYITKIIQQPKKLFMLKYQNKTVI